MKLIKFIVLCFCVSTFGSFLFLHSFAQMAPTKHAATKKPSSKRTRTDSDHFKSADADMKYNDCYKGATIIMERVANLDSLEGTFILKVFKERTWTKILNPFKVVYSEIIREFFSNAAIHGDCIECWVRHKEFVISREIIQGFLEVRPPSQPIEVQYEDKNTWWHTEEIIHEHNTIFTGDESFGICDDPQLISGHQPHHFICSKDKIFV